MKKVKCFVNFAKEEAWLRQMAAEGWYFTGRGPLATHFAEGEPGEAVFRIDYRTFKSAADFHDYVALFADAGWRHLEGSRWSGAQYFVKLRADGAEDIFSDGASRAGRYRRLTEMWVSILICYAMLFFTMVSTGSIDIGMMLDPKSAYLTPGLWQLTGFAFWRAFLFETPFALMRGFAWWVIPLGLVVAVGFLLAIRRAERRA